MKLPISLRVHTNTDAFVEELFESFKNHTAIPFCVIAHHGGSTFDIRQVVQAHPAPWNGEGLPPVGMVCEYSIMDTSEWHTCEIRYASPQVVVFNNERWADQASSERVKFRPIRTAEQIAAEERERSIDAMLKIAEGPHDGGSRKVHASRPQIAAIYDAGYRKQVQP